ncbi:MAG TPA: hypothetical protein VGM05_26925 [Planctomycetaceae bacterium]|jgi:hypothetical protein
MTSTKTNPTEQPARKPGSMLRTWRDFPEFVSAVRELDTRKAFLKSIKEQIDNRNSFFGQPVDPTVEARIAARVEALDRGVAAAVAMPPTNVELLETLEAAARRFNQQMQVVRRLATEVKQRIGADRLNVWRAIVTQNRDALLNLQSQIDGMRSFRTQFLFDCGEGEEWGLPNAIGGGHGEPGAMVLPLSTSCFKGEHEFVHHLKAQATHFVEAANSYLEASKPQTFSQE